jgi:putative transposase
MHQHHPPHIYLDNTWYLVTASTRDRAGFLADDGIKLIVRDALRVLASEHRLSIRAWVILDNHYHLLLRTPDGVDLARFFRRLHAGTAREINHLASAPGRQVWHNYWDSCIRADADLWRRFNYVHHNPVKHGYVASPEEWPFSSYRHYLRTRGKPWLDDCWERYPAAEGLTGDDFGSRAGTAG